MGIADLRDAYHTLRIASDSQEYCGITHFYGSLTYSYLRLGMGFSTLPTIWQPFIDKVLKYIPKRERWKIIDSAIKFPAHKRYLEGLANLFQTLIQFRLKILSHIYPFSRKHLKDISITIMLRMARYHIHQWEKRAMQ